MTNTLTGIERRELAKVTAGKIRLLFAPDQIVESRVLNVKNGRWSAVHFGYYDQQHLVELVTGALSLTDRARGCYFTVNPVDPAFLARRANRIAEARNDPTVADGNIMGRRWMIVDCDAGQVAGVSANDLEKAATVELANEVKDSLCEAGFPFPVVIDSGNGTALLFRVDLPADDGGLIKRCLESLASRFRNGKAHVDPKVFNASRIYRLPGTLNRKGDSTADRPHRRCQIRELPEDLTTVATLEQLEQLASLVVKPEKAAHEAAPSKNGPRKPSKSQTVERRAIAYLAKMEPGIQGQHGSDPTLYAARVVVYGFDLGQERGFELLSAHYNQRCQPPWPDDQLRRKCKEADEKPFDQPRGWLLDKKRTETQKPDALPASGVDGESQLIFSNFEEQWLDGQDHPTCIGLSAQIIRTRLSAKTGDWPRRVGSALFVPDGNRGPLFLTKPVDLFAWIQCIFPSNSENLIQWSDRGTTMVSRTELHAYLSQTATRYEAIESAPHEPMLEGHFYIHPTVSDGDGAALETLLARFAPATIEDLQLIKAFLLTLAWGGPYGQRPAFLFTGQDDDDHMGRGLGKTTLVRMVARLFGGTFDIRLDDDWGDVIKRLLSNTECATQRVVLLDNVKRARFSWGDLEAFITSERINGRKMYVGDSSRPNGFTVAITLNGASLSKDLAQRCIIVKLRRPIYSGNWESDTAAFIDAHRWKIVGDLLAILKRPVIQLASFSRWGIWQHEILGRLECPEVLARLIQERRDGVDDDQEEAELIRDAIANELQVRGHGDPDRTSTRIPASVMAQIVGQALNERLSTTAVGTKLRSMAGAIPELTKAKSGSRRYWLWSGKFAWGDPEDLHSEPVLDTG